MGRIYFLQKHDRCTADEGNCAKQGWEDRQEKDRFPLSCLNDGTVERDLTELVK